MDNNDLQNEKMQALGALAGSVAHDLNNILTAVLGHISFIKRMEFDDSASDSIKAVEDGVKRAAKLTQQILDFSRKDETTSVHAECDLCEVLRASIPLISPSLPEEVTLGIRMQSSSIKVLADDTKVTQIILNLVVNARDAMPQGGKIMIGIETQVFDVPVAISGFSLQAGSYAKISVADQGHGISESIKGNIFDPFFTTKKGTGTGLGLATVFSIVKSLGGAIHLESFEGAGTTFEVYLPLLRSIPVHAEAPREVKNKNESLHSNNTAAQSTKKILVVDDEDAVRLVLQKSLEILGYDVLVAENGAVALSLYSQEPHQISLVIMDMIMPNMPGDELFYHLKSISPHVSVLISSGYSSDGKTQELLKNGAVGFIQKPFTIEDLAVEVKKVLEQ